MTCTSHREDGVTYGTPTWIWSVAVDGNLYVRAYNGKDSRWYQAARRQRAGRIIAAGMTREVTFEPVEGTINDRIDDAYRAKYRGSPYLSPMVSARTRAASVKVMPRETERNKPTKNFSMNKMSALHNPLTALILAAIAAVFLASRTFAQTPKPVERSNQMKIKIGSNTFIATLEDNATAAAFKALLPMTVNMSDLNGNEKYFRLSNNLPTNASNPGTIQSGDLMIYSSKTLVLFYKTFPTTYSYTPLGRINDTTELAAAVGSGSVTVTFELEQKQP
jgi:hypothetical protein